MNTHNVVQVWILARLFEQDQTAFHRKDLLRELCSQSIEAMERPEDLQEALNSLASEGLIEDQGNAFYQITEKGMFTYRKEIIGGVQKRHNKLVRQFKDFMPANLEKYNAILEALNNTKDITKSVLQLCLVNAPLVVAFLKDIIL